MAKILLSSANCWEQNNRGRRRIGVEASGVCLGLHTVLNRLAVTYGLYAGGCAEFMATGEHSARRLERRWAPRYSFRADLEIEWGSAVLPGKTRDISANGMFIEAADTLWIGAGFTARLNLERPVKVDCFVKRVEPGLGMGVAVALAEIENQKYYQQLLDSLAGNRPSAAL